jgi:hypothetical protein
MADSRYRDVYVQMLLDHIERDEYPSVNQLDMVESMLRPDQMDAYLRILMAKIEGVDFPSVPMMQRVQRLVLQLPAAQVA